MCNDVNTYMCNNKFSIKCHLYSAFYNVASFTRKTQNKKKNTEKGTVEYSTWDKKNKTILIKQC